jgi:hypothetical protein
MEMRQMAYVKKESERHLGGDKDMQGVLHEHPSLPSAAIQHLHSYLHLQWDGEMVH